MGKEIVFKGRTYPIGEVTILDTKKYLIAERDSEKTDDSLEQLNLTIDQYRALKCPEEIDIDALTGGDFRELGRLLSECHFGTGGGDEGNAGGGEPTH